MPIVRGDHIGVTVFGGGRVPGNLDGKCEKWEDMHGNPAGGKRLDAGAAYEAQGAFGAGLIDIEELLKMENVLLSQLLTLNLI